MAGLPPAPERKKRALPDLAGAEEGVTDIPEELDLL
jgi:hypothetical protein